MVVAVSAGMGDAVRRAAMLNQFGFVMTIYGALGECGTCMLTGWEVMGKRGRCAWNVVPSALNGAEAMEYMGLI